MFSNDVNKICNFTLPTLIGQCEGNMFFLLLGIINYITRRNYWNSFRYVNILFFIWICHCRSLKALWNFMKRQGINTSAVWDNMKDLIIKTVIW